MAVYPEPNSKAQTHVQADHNEPASATGCLKSAQTHQTHLVSAACTAGMVVWGQKLVQQLRRNQVQVLGRDSETALTRGLYRASRRA
eukprot:1162068-Pelagomonas_calceolata.AAC.3